MQIIVHDESDWLTTILRLKAGSANLSVRHLPRWADIRTKSSQSRGLFVVFGLCERSTGEIIERITELTLSTERAASVVIAERGLESWEFVLREAGAKHFQCGERGLERVINMAENHAKLQPRTEVSLRERIWASLPWGED